MFHFIETGPWDIFAEQETTTMSQTTMRQIMREVKELVTDPPYGIFVEPDDNDATVVHALITGAEETPYQGGCFYFILKCPCKYPHHPPRAKLMSTGGGTVRFNPNFYENGKVCLSILGTWAGPTWNSKLGMKNVLTSIQTVMNEAPYFNEPGYSAEKFRGDSNKYNRIITHETLRVAVCGMLENDTALHIPPKIVKKMQETFLENYDYYVKVVMENKDLTGVPMEDPFFGTRRGQFDYGNVLTRLKVIHATLCAQQSHTDLDNCSNSISASTTCNVNDDNKDTVESAPDSEGSCQIAGPAPVEIKPSIVKDSVTFNTENSTILEFSQGITSPKTGFSLLCPAEEQEDVLNGIQSISGGDKKSNMMPSVDNYSYVKCQVSEQYSVIPIGRTLFSFCIVFLVILLSIACNIIL